MKTTFSMKLGSAVLFMAASLAGVGCSTTNLPEPSLGFAFGDEGVQRHVYAGTGVGASNLTPDDDFLSGFDRDDQVEPAGQITLGADINRAMAFEFSSADLGSAGFSQGGRINYQAHGASALLYGGKGRNNYKRQGLSPFARLGVGYVTHNSEGPVPGDIDDRANVMFGGGLEYMTRLGLGMRAEAVQFDHDAHYAQLGMIYRTGARRESRPVEIVLSPDPEPAPVAAKPEPVVYDACSDFNGALDGVNFEFDSASLTSTARNILDNVASVLSECETAPVSISAHTDSIGTERYNDDLSQRRASSVSNYLNNAGIDTSRMTSTALGESQPIDSNATSEGRSRNRRVELIAQ